MWVDKPVITKMNPLTKMLYKLQMISLLLSPVRRLNFFIVAFMQFLWKGKWLKVKLKSLFHPIKMPY